MKDPFEAAFRDQESESPPESPIHTLLLPPPQPPPESENLDPFAAFSSAGDDDTIDEPLRHPPQGSAPPHSSAAYDGGGGGGKGKEEDDDDDDENMGDVELEKFSSADGDPDKMVKMQAILSQFSEEQMSRYETYRRSIFQKSNMKRLLASITGSQKISLPMTIVVSGIAKLLVGDLIETGRMVMAERMESGPIRPCHIREAYRRLKLEGKIPKRSVQRLFR